MSTISASTTSQDLFERLAADRERERSLAELLDYLKIPSISTDPAYAADVDRCADWLLANAWPRPASPPRRSRPPATRWSTPSGWARARSGRRSSSTATTTCSRPIRSPSGATRRSSRHESRATSSWPAARPTTRGSRTPTSKGVGDDARRARRGCRSTSSSSSRARRSRAARRSSASCARTPGGGSPATRSWSPTPSMYAPGQPSLDLRPARASPTSRSACSGPNRDLHSGAYGGGGREPGQRPRRASSPRCATRRPAASRSPASTTTCGRSRSGSARSSPALGFDEAANRADLGGRRRSPARPASPTLERTWARPDLRRQRHLRAATRARGRRPCCRPGPAPRSRSGWSPTRRRRRSPSCSRAHVARVAPPGVRGRGRGLHGAAGGRRSTPPGRSPRRRSRRIEDVWGARAGAHPQRRLDPDRRHLRRGAGRAGAAPRLRPRRRPAALAEREVRHQPTSTAASGRWRGCSTASARCGV